MKRKIYTLVLLVVFSYAGAQNSLRQIIKGADGTTKHQVDLQQNLQAFFNLSQVNNLLGLDGKSNLQLIRSEKDKLGFIHYRFYQTYNDIPVEDAMYIIHTKNNKIVALSGSIILDFANDMQQKNVAGITPKQAVDAAVHEVNATEYMWQDASMEKQIKLQTHNRDATYRPTAEKVWFDNDENLVPGKLRLAYKIDIYAKQPLSRAYYFIDAQTGKLLGKEDRIHTSDAVGICQTLYSGKRYIHSTNTGNSEYVLRDYSRGLGIITLHGDNKEHSDYTNTSAKWKLDAPDQNALDAHYGVEKTYDFYKVNFNRNSLDDNGAQLYSYVNEKGTTDNAFWDGSSMHFGTRSGSTDGVTGIDVTGHELTHGVTQNTCALVYSNQSGGINESLSDIMGKAVQFWAKPNDIDWQLSNDMDWFIRDMSNPNAFGQPDTYKGQHWGGNWLLDLLDNGGVHRKSGVGNFMFYLLVSGGSGTNDNGDAYKVTGIGFNSAEQIIYRSQTAYLTSRSQYPDWRIACINAAIDIFGAGSVEVRQVKSAWHAVGVDEILENIPATRPEIFAGNEEATNTANNLNVTATPNPVTGSAVSLNYTLNKAGAVTINVFYANGLTAYTKFAGNQSAGKNNFVLNNMAALKNGTYYIVIQQNSLIVGRTPLLISH